VYGGEIVKVTRLSTKPIINARTKRILLRATIFFASTYFVSLAGIDYFSSIKFLASLALSAIPAFAAFFTKVGDELKNPQN
jgi:hypothetical protein